MIRSTEWKTAERSCPSGCAISSSGWKRSDRRALDWKPKAQAAEKDTGNKSGGPGRPSKNEPGTPKDSAQTNFTDPESRIMKSHDGFIQAYNVQAAVDADSQVIVAQTVTNNASDAQQLAPMVAQIKHNTGRQAQELSADAGYCSEDNLKELRRRHINGYIATGRQKHGQATATGERKIKLGTYAYAMWQKLRRGGHRSRYRLRKANGGTCVRSDQASPGISPVSVARSPQGLR